MSVSPEVYDPSSATSPTVHTPEKLVIGNLKFWALGDRVLVEEDIFRTGYECPTCEGRATKSCDNCNGQGFNVTQDPATLDFGVEKKCSPCDGKGTVPCPDCNGKGGLIIAPEVSERRPSSGRIVSAGQKCQYLREGDSVLYSNFAGYVVDLNRAGSPVCLRILHESEILAAMEGHLTLANLKGKSEIAQFNP